VERVCYPFVLLRATLCHADACHVMCAVVLCRCVFVCFSLRCVFFPPPQVCHLGYVTFFPLFFGLVSPQSPRLGRLLETMHDPEHLWSRHGLRSLSRSHSLYLSPGSDWRGGVWVSYNVLALQALQRYASVEGPWKVLASTMLKEYVRFERFGIAWRGFTSLLSQIAPQHCGDCSRSLLRVWSAL